jgi:hypothetical protein
MADEVDVENALVSLIANAIYPNGTTGASAAGVPVKVFRGWPTPQAQQAAIAGNFVNVSVATRNGVARNTTNRRTDAFYISQCPVHTLTATVSGDTITIGGTVSVPQNVVVLIGKRFVTSYGVQATDTLDTIAAGVAALIAPAFPGTTSSGATVNINLAAAPFKARIASTGKIFIETKRQEKSFQISIWAPPSNVPGADADSFRTAVVNIVDPALSHHPRISLPDDQLAHIHYERSISMDTAQAEGLYRRDLFYWVEYRTTIQKTPFEIGAMQTQIEGGQAPGGLQGLQNLPVPTVDANS